jgi:hypothetical protein
LCFLQRLIGSVSHCLNKLDGAALKIAIANFRERLQHPKGVCRLEKSRDFAAAFSQVIVKEHDRDLQDVGDLLQPSRADPIYSFLVFLNLLKRNLQRVSQLGLRDT